MSAIIEAANDYAYLRTEDEALLLKLWKILRFRDKNYAFNAAYRMKVWDGFKDFFDKNNGKFLSGLLPDVMAALKVWDVPFELKDNRGLFDFTVKSVDENFLPGVKLRDYQVDYINQALKLRRGLVCSQTGCHAKGQGILMYDGTIKSVESIEIGDLLMGPDSNPRTVGALCRGRSKMYRIIPANGNPFVVNGEHVLTLIKRNSLVDVTVSEWLSWNDSKKNNHKLIKAGVSFNQHEYKILPLDPYFLGVFLCGGCEPNEKFIPHSFKTASAENRYSLLAGLIDVDGNLGCNSCEYISQSKTLVNDVCFVARSLGFSCDIECFCKYDESNNSVLHWRVRIFGNTDLIPCVIKKKCPSEKNKAQDLLYTSFHVEELCEDDYYGFTLIEEPHYLLDDFTVTHNSGKTNIMIGILKAIPSGTPTLVLCNKTDLVEQNYDEIKKFGFDDVGRVHGKKKEIDKTILCVTWQSIGNIKHLLKKFKALIVDEIHDMMSPKVKIIYRVMTNACVRIGFSATAFKFGGEDEVQKYATKGFFGPPFYCKSAEGGRLTTAQLQERDILSTATFTFYKVDKPDLPYEIYQDAVTKGVAENTYFHEIVTQLTHMLKGRTIIMVERIKQGDMLKEMLPDAAWVSGKDNTKTRKEIKERLKYEKGNVVAIATTGIFNTGINVFIHNLINAAGGKADHAIIQRLGRGLRPSDDKEMLRYYDFYFTINKYLENHSIKRIKVLKKEGHKIDLRDGFDFNQIRVE